MGKLKIFLFFIVISINCTGQEIARLNNTLYSWPFFKYLNENHLYSEAKTWLFTFQYIDSVETNRVSSELALICLKTNQIDSANFYFSKVTSFNTYDTLSIAIKVAFINKDINLAQKYLDTWSYIIPNSLLTDYQNIIEIFKTGPNLTINPVFTSRQLTEILNQYILHKNKSTPLAVFLSSIIPGAGKFYLGYKKQAFSAFTSNTLLLAAVLESVYIGTLLVNLYISLPLFAVFYIGNIWGTYELSKKRTIDFKNQMYEDIINLNISDLSQFIQ